MSPNRKTIPIAAALMLAAACVEKNPGTTPPLDAFHFPVSVVYPPGTAGVLYVVSSNFDLKYNRGTVLALDLANLDNRLSQSPDVLVADLATAPAAGAPRTDYVFIDSFAGTPAVYKPSALPEPARRLFVPTRENASVFAIDANGTALSCRNPASQDCSQGGAGGTSEGIRLVTGDGNVALDPFAASAIGANVVVTHLRDAQTSGGNNTGSAFLATLDAENPTAPLVFTELIGPTGLTSGPAGYIATVANSTLYFTNAPFSSASALRYGSLGAKRTISQPDQHDALLSSNYRIAETRGLAASTDQTRLFATTRGSSNSSVAPTSGPDGLLVLDVVSNRATQLVPLPAGASFMAVIPRGTLRDLVAVSCTESNLVAIYDDEIGSPVALVKGISEPYGLAYAPRPGGGARLFVASFGGHRVWIVDMLDVTKPADVSVVGSIGGAR